MEEKEKRSLPWEPILLVLLLALLLWQGWQIKQLSDGVDSLKNRVEDRVELVLNRLYDSEARLSDEIKALEDPISEYAITPVGVDKETKSVLMDVSVTLKEMQANTVVLLGLRTEEGESSETFLSGDMTGKFTTREPVAISLDTEAVYLSATVVRNGVYKTQELEVTSPYLFLPIRQSSMGWSGEYSYEEGVFYMIDWPSVLLEDREGQPAQISEGAFHIYRNDAEVFSTGVKLPEEEPLAAYEPQEWQWEFEAEPGDTFRLTFSCRDGNGLGYEFVLHNVSILADGRVQHEHLDGGGTPRLFW